LDERVPKIVLVSILLVSLSFVVIVAYAAKGGILYYYDDDPYTPGWVGVDKFYNVEPGQTVKLKIDNIPEPLGDIVFLKLSTEKGWTDWYEVGTPRCIEFTWTCPSDDYYATSFVVQLKKGVEDDPYKPQGSTYIVEGVMSGEGKPAHIRVIPDIAFGIVMGTLSVFSGSGIYSKYRKK